MNFRSLALATLFTMIPSHAAGQSVIDELLNNISRDVAISTVAIVALSADDTFSGGNFHIDSDTAPDSTLDLHKLAHEFTIKELSNPSSALLLDASAGYLSTNQVVPISISQPDELKLEAWSLGGGAGWRFNLSPSLELIPRVKILYAHVSNDYDFASQQSRETLQPIFDHSVFNFDMETVTTTYSLEYRATPITLTDKNTLTFSSLGSYLYTDIPDAGERIGSFHAQSTLWRNSIEIDFSELMQIQNSQLSLKPLLARTDAYGDAANGLGFDNFYEVGFSLAGSVPQNQFISSIILGCNYVYEKEIHGWRIGVSGSLS